MLFVFEHANGAGFLKKSCACYLLKESEGKSVMSGRNYLLASKGTTKKLL